MKSGIIVLYKTEGITSQGAVTRTKRLLNAEKAGHTGTLDPLATGVLPILIGRAVKASEYMICSDKHYSAVLKLGLETDTEDITGSVLSSSDKIPDEDQVRKTVLGFVGNIMQIPPMYSALKVGGKKLCDLARDGVSIEREAREITVHSIDVKKLSEDRYALDVHCSKGTYIRTLCADIGRALGCGGVMEALKRTRASVFTLEDSITLEELEAMSEEERDAALVPIERVFEGYEKITLEPFFARLARCGAPIYLKKIGASLDVGTRVRLADGQGFFALGEVVLTDGEPTVKPIKQFDT